MSASAGASGACGGIASGVVLLVLVASSVGHARRPGGVREALRAHRVLPAWVAAGAALAAPAAEAVVAAGGLAALAAGHRAALALALGGAGVLFAGYAAYARHVVAGGHGGPCGCAWAEVPMSDWVAVRALALAALAGVGVLTVGAGAEWPGGAAERAVVLLASAALALLLWLLPAAMAQPANRPAHRPAKGQKGQVPRWTS